jgi:hypothetical protein
VNKVKAGFFSFTEITDPSEHRGYNEWHQLDHMPEQYPLRGVAFAQRWVSTPACRAARAVDKDPLSSVHYMTLYLMTEPLGQTVDEFMDLGRQLYSLGRFHQYRRAVVSGAHQWLDAHVAPRVRIAAETVPYRPNRGIYVTVEEPHRDADTTEYLEWMRRWHEHEADRWTAVGGIAGSWSFATSPFLRDSRWTPGNRRITVHYLDGDPLEVADAVRPLLEDRWRDAPVNPIHAGPYETILPFHWDWFD